MNRFTVIPVLFFAALLALLVSGQAQVARAADPGPTDIPVVFVLGIGGSRLADSNNVEYWTAAGYSGHDQLTLYPSQPHPTLYATSAITEATFRGVHIPFEDWQTYGPLLTYLGTQGFVQYNTYQNPALQTSAGCDLTQAPNHPNLFVFAYDWRKSNAESADLLADYIACVQKFYHGTNVNLVAHSMGGLVARRYIISHPGTHHVNALVSVASPYIGASKVVWVEETGQYVFFVWASTLLNVVGSFNGASELLNTQAWYDLGGLPALIENGQDLNGDGKTNEKFSYPMLVNYMDTAKGQEGFLPGTANQTFHSYSNGGNSQDDWRNDTTGVKYFHIVGEGLMPDTINQVVAASFWNCIKNYSICNLSTWMYPKFTQGDTTVPILSSSRIGANLNYNAPNATVYTCQAFGANNQNVDHVGMLSNPVVQGLLVGYLTQANGGAVVDPPPGLSCGNGGNAPVTAGLDAYSHRVELVGVTDVEVTDGSADPVTDGVQQFNVGADASTLLLANGQKYKIKFHATDQPLYVEWLYQNQNKPLAAMRYRDVEFAPNALVQFTLKDGKMSKLRYDTNNDGAVDTRVKPTAALVGKPATDLRAPKVKMTTAPQASNKLVTLTARDKQSAIARIVYSLDGQNFQVYTGPFVVDTGVTKLYAFADDAVGNRSKPKTFALP